MRKIVSIALVSVVAACAPVEKPQPIVASILAVAELKKADGSISGVAKLSKRNNIYSLNIAVSNLTPGTFGMHLHAVGKCDGPDFVTAGPHWNPEQKQHGLDNPLGTHSGDLRNIVVNAAGVAAVETTLPVSTSDGSNGPMDADGLAIIIHEKADDYSTDPSGNSGKRIVCGVFLK